MILMTFLNLVVNLGPVVPEMYAHVKQTLKRHYYTLKTKKTHRDMAARRRDRMEKSLEFKKERVELRKLMSKDLIS